MSTDKNKPGLYQLSVGMDPRLHQSIAMVAPVIGKKSADIIREGIAAVLEKYRDKYPGELPWPRPEGTKKKAAPRKKSTTGR